MVIHKTIKRSRKRKVVILMLSSLVFILLLEAHLRLYWGFCDSVLMMENSKYEYIPQPNQNRFRFRNHIVYNSFSMRSPEVDTTANTILGFGDSVINGGVAVDQDSLATTLLSNWLSNSLQTNIQLLNISSGSWGPDNCYAYLKEHGNFNAKVIFLVVSSHDAYDNMDFAPVIDKQIRYETKQYPLAIWELIIKYAIPKLMNTESSELGISKKGTNFNSGFADFVQYSKDKGISFFVYLHADKNELAGKQYSSQGKDIIAFCKANDIECIQNLGLLEETDYRGGIHLNEAGQYKLAKHLYAHLIKSPVLRD